MLGWSQGAHHCPAECNLSLGEAVDGAIGAHAGVLGVDLFCQSDHAQGHWLARECFLKVCHSSTFKSAPVSRGWLDNMCQQNDDKWSMCAPSDRELRSYRGTVRGSILQRSTIGDIFFTS